MLLLDGLTPQDFRLVGLAFDEVTSHLMATDCESGLLPFLEQVQGAIHSDPRWLAR